ncbi:helix-turn-helix domain-containing protein [Aliarcobacter butzleri]|uniref:Helix-turn-helix domain-containing protein n=1 Tax=Aliarcobacter butzleri TaxID=28197 RepID=A0AAW6VGN1_9BACT|nr:helix-turn-helix domain-containing protein [Aliarcobacter butzleri]MDK2041516.1 hypothetical protein [Aliarcobacter butzleri]MDK2096747.1 hypothetical protein [Aliarcobacter butzleri]
MSIKLISQAWDTGQKGNDLLVLLALCDFSNDEGLSYPSLKTLSIKAKVSKTTLSYILRAYEDIGVITRKQRQRDNKSDTSTMYKINHLNIDNEKYKKAYQKARKYKEKKGLSSQCEHHINNHNVNTQNANCEHLEPSNINRHYLNIYSSNSKNLPKLIFFTENEFWRNWNENQVKKLISISKLEELARANKENEILSYG